MKWIICLFRKHIPKEFTQVHWVSTPGGPNLPLNVPVIRCVRCGREL